MTSTTIVDAAASRYTCLPVVGRRRSPSEPAGRRAIADRTDDCFVSVGSCWEIAIKVSLEKLLLASPVDRFIPEHLAANEFSLLPVELGHTSRVAVLPFHHRDPFDRLLAAQALAEGASTA